MPRMTGKRAMIEQLMADGVRRIFDNPGTTEQGFMDALRDYPQMEFMLALHEGVAVCMADAYARVTRGPAFVEVHIAPGLGNSLGMLHNAAVGKTPLVVYAGQSPGATLLQEPHLSGPLVDMARPVCKWAAQIHHAHDVPRALRRAFKVAMEPPQGPVFLSLPMDTLDEEADVDIEPTTHTRWRGRVDPAGMAEVAALLLGAERPMLMVGDGIALADAQPEVVALAETAGLPVFECYASEFTMPASHPLNQGALNFVTPGPLRATLEGCDLLLVVGAPMFQLIFPEAITNSAHLTQALMPDEPGRLVRVRGGGIGPGLPGSLGAQLARPDRKVVGICSDGAAMYSISALWTAAHHRIPVTYVMLNNAAYRILKLNMVEYLGKAARGRGFTAMDLTDPELRFDRMAESMGVPGFRVDKPDDLAPILKKALDLGGPSLVDVVMESPVPIP